MRVKAIVKMQIECIAEVWLEENETTSELTVEEVINIGDIKEIGEFDVLDYL